MRGGERPQLNGLLIRGRAIGCFASCTRRCAALAARSTTFDALTRTGTAAAAATSSLLRCARVRTRIGSGGSSAGGTRRSGCCRVTAVKRRVTPRLARSEQHRRDKPIRTVRWARVD